MMNFWQKYNVSAEEVKERCEKRGEEYDKSFVNYLGMRPAYMIDYAIHQYHNGWNSDEFIKYYTKHGCHWDAESEMMGHTHFKEHYEAHQNLCEQAMIVLSQFVDLEELANEIQGE